MYPDICYEIDDKSYYADRLKEITGKPRSYWGQFPLERLQQIYRKELLVFKSIPILKGEKQHENAHC